MPTNKQTKSIVSALMRISNVEQKYYSKPHKGSALVLKEILKIIVTDESMNQQLMQ